MERSTNQSLTKSELRRRRDQELADAWGGLSLEEAINSSPYQRRSKPSNLETGSNII